MNFEEVIEAVQEFGAPALWKDGIAIPWRPEKGWRDA
jgi:hypothetical protein